jgi:phage baseplate assembly protein W
MRLSLPLAVVRSGRMATVPADSPQALAQSVALLLDTRPGERRSVKEYGLPNGLFSNEGADPAQIRSVVQQWEPDTSVGAIDNAVTGAAQTLGVHLEPASEDFV